MANISGLPDPTAEQAVANVMKEGKPSRFEGQDRRKGVLMDGMEMTTRILDSGDRREFETGAVRDMAEGKGRCDLMPLEQVATIISGDADAEDEVIANVYEYQQTGDVDYILMAIYDFCTARNWTIPKALLELSKHFEQGAIKYGERNWEKGLPEYCYIDSALRHYLKWMDGQDDEPHDRAVLWNLMCLWWTHENITTADRENKHDT